MTLAVADALSNARNKTNQINKKNHRYYHLIINIWSSSIISLLYLQCIDQHHYSLSIKPSHRSFLCIIIILVINIKQETYNRPLISYEYGRPISPTFELCRIGFELKQS